MGTTTTLTISADTALLDEIAAVHEDLSAALRVAAHADDHAMAEAKNEVAAVRDRLANLNKALANQVPHVSGLWWALTDASDHHRDTAREDREQAQLWQNWATETELASPSPR